MRKKTLAPKHTQFRNEDQALKTFIEMKDISAYQDNFWSEEGFRP